MSTILLQVFRKKLRCIAFSFLSVLLIVPVTLNAQVEFKNDGFKAHSRLSESKLTDDVNVPLTEIDSFYDSNTEVWYYSQDAVHEYYSNNCKDSVVTYLENGEYISRVLYQYDQFDNVTDALTQTYLVNNWFNASDFQNTVQSIGCVTDYIIDRSWNGLSWDTAYGLRESVTFNNYDNPTVRTYVNYVNGAWMNSRQVIENYDNQNQLIGEDTYLWNQSNSQFELSSRTTGYEYASYASFCDRAPTYYLSQIYVNGSWENSSLDSIYYPDNFGSATFVLYLWDGNAFVPSSKSSEVFDSHGNLIQSTSQTWSSGNSAWVTDGEFQNEFTYGNSGEVIRRLEKKWNCSPNDDQLAPCTVARYANFELCSPLTTVIPTENPRELLLFPNPASDIIAISETGLHEGDLIIITNLLGQEVYVPRRHEDDKVVLDIRSLPTGLYTVSLPNGNSKFCKY